jgi:hypothetical protein
MYTLSLVDGDISKTPIYYTYICTTCSVDSTTFQPNFHYLQQHMLINTLWTTWQNTYTLSACKIFQGLILYLCHLPIDLYVFLSKLSLLSTTYASKYILDCFTSTHTLSLVDLKYFKDSYYTYTTCSIDPQAFFNKLSLLPATYTSKYIMNYFTKNNHLKFNGSKMFQGLILYYTTYSIDPRDFPSKFSILSSTYILPCTLWTTWQKRKTLNWVDKKLFKVSYCYIL